MFSLAFMDPSRWQSIGRIFHAALELPAGERRDFVLAEAGADGDLASEVQRLLEADEEARSFLQTPLAESDLTGAFRNLESAIAVGTVLGDRFELQRAVGEGGMGRVYQGWDRELERSVAVKILLPEVSDQPEALARFRREVRLALDITHPNVCRTYHLNHAIVRDAAGNPRKLQFLTMEFLEGENLGERIHRDGRLPTDEALEIARQVAAGLDAAHRAGVLHRDVKPANIHLVPSPEGLSGNVRAVITDFGLARYAGARSAGESISTAPLAGLVGTLSYMAPEQLAGGVPSSAADIYAFGLVLFEMVTGQRAFPSDSLLSGIARRLNGLPPSCRAAAAIVPLEWEPAIERCLRINAEERFRFASEAIAVLEGHSVEKSSSASLDQPGAEKPRAGTLLVRGRIAAAILWLIAVVSLTAAAVRYYWTKVDSVVAAGALVYLAPVSNRTGDQSLKNLTQLIETELGQSVHIRLLDEDQVEDILRQMTKSPDASIDPVTAREVAGRAGAARVVLPYVYGSKGSYRLEIDLQQLDNTPTRYRRQWTRSFTWQCPEPAMTSKSIPPELLGTIRDASDWIRHRVGESAYDIARLNAAPEDVTTGNWDALEAYSDAERMIANRQTERALDPLRNAVRLDSGFALAYARLGDVLNSLGRDVEGYQAEEKALDVSLENRLTRRERDRIRGMFALDTGDEAAAEAAFRDYATYYENDYAGWFYRAYPLLMLGRPDEAIETLRRAYAVDPGRISAPAHLARFELVVDVPAEAWKWQSWLASRGFANEADFAAGQIDLYEGHIAEAEKAFGRMTRSNDAEYVSLGNSLLARTYAEEGKIGEAESSLLAGLAADTTNGLTAQQASQLLDSASIHCDLHETSEAVEEISQAARLYPGLSTFQLASDVAGRCGAESRQSREAMRAALVELNRVLPLESDSLRSIETARRLRGELLLAEGHWKDGLAEMNRASTAEMPFGNHDYLARAWEEASLAETDARLREVDCWSARPFLYQME